ncbi:hypothetical protein V8G54_019181 [Vigna mungo]|uniref:Uncharacterized protein n=1 Tax=Vigna mungo TaxID=3915 RepID=A0AAQ3N9I4_VIGMU
MSVNYLLQHEPKYSTVSFKLYRMFFLFFQSGSSFGHGNIYTGCFLCYSQVYTCSFFSSEALGTLFRLFSSHERPILVDNDVIEDASDSSAPTERNTSFRSSLNKMPEHVKML